MRFSGFNSKLFLLQVLVFSMLLLLFCPTAIGVVAEDFGVGAADGLDFNYLPFPFFVIVSAQPEEGGTVEGAGEFYAEINTTVRAIPAEGYYFINWTEKGKEVSRDPEYSFKVTGDLFITANFSTDQYTPPVIVPGDVNADGAIDVKDVSLVIRHVLELDELDESGKEAADVNGDGVVNIKDITLIIRRALNIIGKFPVEIDN